MKKRILFIIVPLIIILSSCSGDTKDWQSAKKQNTIQAYEQFIKEYPKSLYADSASLKLKEVESEVKIKINVPDYIKNELKAGAPEKEYAFYALNKSAPASWDDIKNGGLWICGEFPPLVPDKVQAFLDGGAFVPGTVVTLKSDDFEDLTEGNVKSKLGMKIIVSIGVTFDGCTEGAFDKMEKSPGMLLLTNRDADFDGKEEIVEITFH